VAEGGAPRVSIADGGGLIEGFLHPRTRLRRRAFACSVSEEAMEWSVDFAGLKSWKLRDRRPKPSSLPGRINHVLQESIASDLWGV